MLTTPCSLLWLLCRHLTFYKQAAFGAVDAAGETIGWSGFTFNPLLFDSHAQYLAWLRRFHLHSSMNIHPLSGIQPWEETHAAMVDAMGQTNRSAYVPFNLTDQRFMRAWFNITMRPLDVDVWWLDWSIPHSHRISSHLAAHPSHSLSLSRRRVPCCYVLCQEFGSGFHEHAASDGDVLDRV